MRIGGAALALGAVAAAAALVLVTPARPEASAKPAAPSGAPVRETTLACPRLLVRPSGVDTSFNVGSAEVEDSAAGSLTTSPGGALTLARGQAAEVDTSTQQGLVVRGTEGSARGLFAWRADTGDTTAVARCAAPAASWWFTGAGAAIDHESRLVLTNVDSAEAVVDVHVYSPDGEVDIADTGGRGIEVPAGGQVSTSLVHLTPQNDELSVWVHATRGRVSAAMFDGFSGSANATAPSGYEWLPAEPRPSKTVRLSGVVPDARSQTLVVANPSDLEALVSLELAGPNGRFVPAGLDELSVSPGSVATLDLSTMLPGDAFAVRLRSQQPVVATVRSVTEDDVVYASSVEPLTGSAAAPVVGSSTVQLTSGGETTRATLTAYSADGRVVATDQPSLAANSTTTWEVPDKASYVVLEPTQGTPVAAMVYDGAATPFGLLPDTTRVPVVQPAA